jgi:hypothetical protein
MEADWDAGWLAWVSDALAGADPIQYCILEPGSCMEAGWEAGWLARVSDALGRAAGCPIQYCILEPGKLAV